MASDPSDVKVVEDTRYQLMHDGRPWGPMRVDWHQAAQDAVNAGLGTWKDFRRDTVILDNDSFIERIDVPHGGSFR